ncbi:DUF1579 domain-containing protein [bacterium]|nr:DUF1579 domain-containing protein [bacterium]MCI0606129.1 DUF1579 domain-containing protein [bacterium]
MAVRMLSLILICFWAHVGIVNSQDQGAPQGNALSRLEFFIGDWKTAGKMFPAGTNQPVETSGRIAYRWASSLWLIFDHTAAMPEKIPYSVHGIVGYDPASGEYVAYAFNSMNPVAIRYRGNWRDENTLVFDSDAFPDSRKAQRITYSRQADGTVRFYAENAHDGTSFSPHSDLLLSH